MNIYDKLEGRTTGFRVGPWYGYGPEITQRVIFQEDVIILRDFYVGPGKIITWENQEEITFEFKDSQEALVFMLDKVKEDPDINVNLDFLAGWLIGCLDIFEKEPENQ